MTDPIVSQTMQTQRNVANLGLRPQVNKRTGKVRLMTNQGLALNSLLTRDEWETVQRITYSPASIRTNALDVLRAAGLIITEDLFVIVTQWNEASERAAASQNILMGTLGEQDQIDHLLGQATVPIISAPFAFDARVLGGSQLRGSPLDVSNAEASGRVVREAIDSNIMNGGTVQRDANSQPFGFVDHPDTITDTAANFGGGDWGTITNITPTVTGMIAAASTNANRRFGPYALFCATAQYTQAQTAFFTEFMQTALAQLQSIESISQVTFSDSLPDGVIVLVQLTSDVVDYTEEQDVTVMEYVSANGATTHFNVWAAGIQRVKGDYDSRSGVVVATGA